MATGREKQTPPAGRETPLFPRVTTPDVSWFWLFAGRGWLCGETALLEPRLPARGQPASLRLPTRSSRCRKGSTECCRPSAPRSAPTRRRSSPGSSRSITRGRRCFRRRSPCRPQPRGAWCKCLPEGQLRPSLLETPAVCARVLCPRAPVRGALQPERGHRWWRLAGCAPPAPCPARPLCVWGRRPGVWSRPRRPPRSRSPAGCSLSPPAGPEGRGGPLPLPPQPAGLRSALLRPCVPASACPAAETPAPLGRRPAFPEQPLKWSLGRCCSKAQLKSWVSPQ